MRNKINKTILTLLLLCFLPLPVSADQTLSTILKHVREEYEGLPGLTLTYRREIISASLSLLGEKGNRDIATGLIHFKPPYFLRIDQQTPRIETVISDGDKLWWYIPQENEVYVYSTRRSARELRLMSDIFQGLKQIEESFVVSLVEEEQTEKTIRIKLTPRPAWPQTESILLSISPDNYRILEVEIRDYIGGITRFIIQGQSVSEFDMGFFRFEIPENARVIEGEG